MTKQIERCIGANKPLAVIQKLVKEELAKDHKAQWNSEMRTEYDLLFPTYRDMTYSEYLARIPDEVNPPTKDEFASEFQYIVYKNSVIIDYSEDETYVSFNDWLNETIVTKEAVEAEYDEDGNVVVEAVAEETELVRPYIAPDNFDTLISDYLTSVEYGKDKIYEEIEALEKQAIRPLRELMIDSTNEYAKTKIEIIDNKIADLRSSL